MSALVKVLPKGQITIPNAVRKLFQIGVNSYLILELQKDSFVLKPLQQKTLSFTKKDFVGRDCHFAPQKERDDEDMEFVRANQKTLS